MIDNPAPPTIHEETQTFKSRFKSSLPYLLPLFTLMCVGIIMIALYWPFSMAQKESKNQDIVMLKNQVAGLQNRLHEFETGINTNQTPISDPNRLNELETKLSTVIEQMGALQTQPKTDDAHHLEQSQAIEKELSQVLESQRMILSLMFFERLKKTVQTDKPYRKELLNFKIISKGLLDLSFLEKYADQGFQILQQEQNNPKLLPTQTPNSWKDRFQNMISSFVKVEKIETAASPSSSLLQDRQIVMENLEQIEQSLIQQIMTTLQSPPTSQGEAQW
jgi:hypothetical protein